MIDFFFLKFFIVNFVFDLAIKFIIESFVTSVIEINKWLFFCLKLVIAFLFSQVAFTYAVNVIITFTLGKIGIGS